RGEDRQCRVTGAHRANAFRRSDQVDESHMLGPAFKEQIKRGQSAAAGCEHWVDENDFKPAQIFWQAFMIRCRLQCFFVSLQADKSHARIWNELQDRWQHSESG